MLGYRQLVNLMNVTTVVIAYKYDYESFRHPDVTVASLELVMSLS